MEKILNYKLFLCESANNEEDEFSLEENIEFCKDFIETFNENSGEFKVSGYKSGFYKPQYKGVISKANDESDKEALTFDLLINGKSELYGDPIKMDDINDSIKLLNKSKIIINRLDRYCDHIVLKFVDMKATFILVFSNIDDLSKLKIFYDKITRIISEKLRDYNNYYKTMHFSNDNNEYHGAGNKRIFELLKDNKKIVKNISSLATEVISIRYATTFTRSDYKEIHIALNTFKYKLYYAGGPYKSITLDRETKGLITNLFMERIKKFFGNSDLSRLEIGISEEANNVIKIKIL